MLVAPLWWRGTAATLADVVVVVVVTVAEAVGVEVTAVTTVVAAALQNPQP